MTRRVLLVAATELELCGHDGLACGIGPVEAAAATARHLRGAKPDAVLHVGVAGGRRLIPGSLVLGTEAVYVDLAAESPVVDRVVADRDLLSALQRLFPDAVSLPIATSAAVSGADATHDLRVEGMEGFGVLRACALGGVPAVEVRAVSNDLGEGDRERWRIHRGLEVLGETLPSMLETLSQ